MDFESKKKIFEVGVNCPPRTVASLDLSKPLDEHAYRTIRYEFSEDVLRLPTIMTCLQFSVGKKEVSSFRMIERHYFREQLVKSYDFAFGFCIPGSTNNWDAIYSMPPLEESLIEEMVSSPYETKSDSFYFVGDKLIMHNKAEYKYTPEDRAQAKRSYDNDDHKSDAKAGVRAETKEDKDSKSAGYDEKWSKEVDYDD